MAATISDPSVVERLKAEGNARHKEGSFQTAYQKYTEAINENPADALLAVLYANRAASCIAMREYLDAMHDGQKAIKCDPKYAKGYARIGTAAHVLELWDVCRRAWTSGLDCLPATGLTPAEVVLKGQFEAGLKAADAGEAKLKAAAKSGKYTSEVTGGIADMPWNRALALAERNKLPKGDLPSSGFVILNAYRDFIRGMKTMGQMVTTQKGNGVEVKTSPALVDITNGILRDHRVFHADSQFFQRLETQVRLEGELTGAWGAGGPKQIQKEVPERLKISGWLPVRRALSITVRIWMMRGFIDQNMGALNGGVEFFKRILDVLEWGRRTYPNVPSEDRGVIFEDSFVRGIRRMYLPAVLGLHLKTGDNSGYTLKDIAQMARDLKAETEASVRSPDCDHDPGFYASFWIYPIGEALSVLGWCHMQLGFRTMDVKKGFHPLAAKDFSKSSEYYIQAAEKHPIDDEQHPYFLAVALEALWWSGAPLRATLPICRRIRAANPKAAKIWEFSQMARNRRNANTLEAVHFLTNCEKKLAEGTATLDSNLMPPDLFERRAARIAQIQDD
ncbi:hypothetical protein DFH06DRAFT_545632 [Mycena polygramma]|nr:hypothetical protein DFH06DRAFT_545632 [Mycena polygramma]